MFTDMAADNPMQTLELLKFYLVYGKVLHWMINENKFFCLQKNWLWCLMLTQVEPIIPSHFRPGIPSGFKLCLCVTPANNRIALKNKL